MTSNNKLMFAQIIESMKERHKTQIPLKYYDEWEDIRRIHNIEKPPQGFYDSKR